MLLTPRQKEWREQEKQWIKYMRTNLAKTTKFSAKWFYYTTGWPGMVATLHNSVRKIEIDCERDFAVGTVFGEVCVIYPKHGIVSMVFMYEQGWGDCHTFDEVVWE